MALLLKAKGIDVNIEHNTGVSIMYLPLPCPLLTLLLLITHVTIGVVCLLSFPLQNKKRSDHFLHPLKIASMNGHSEGIDVNNDVRIIIPFPTTHPLHFTTTKRSSLLVWYRYVCSQLHTVTTQVSFGERS